MAAPGMGGDAGLAGGLGGAGNAGDAVPGIEGFADTPERPGVPGVVMEEGATLGAWVWAVGCCGIGCCGILGAGGPGDCMGPGAGGIGCRGPDKIWPGLGACGGAGGTGRAGMVGARLMIGALAGVLPGEPDCPDASGGLKGNAERRSETGGGVAAVSAGAGGAVAAGSESVDL